MMESASEPLSTQTRFTAPYPGIRPFDESEAPLFFGRGSHIAAMVRLLRREHFLAVLGSSGCGKSSLVKAGLIPALKTGALSGSDVDWRPVVFRPGNQPFENLALAIASASSDSRQIDQETTAFRLETLWQGPSGLVDALSDTLPLENRKWFILVDQFEEIFRFNPANANGRQTLADGSIAPGTNVPQFEQRSKWNEAIRFVDLLLATANARDPSVFVAITMRSDFLGQCDQFADLAPQITRCVFLPPRLTREELQDVIERPLLRPEFHSTIAAEVTSQLLNDMHTIGDQLPRLEHALLRMWVNSHRDSASKDIACITPEVLSGIGGFFGALNEHAEEIYNHLPGNDEQRQYRQAIARAMFLCFSQRTGEGQLVRRLATVQNIADVAATSVPEVITVAKEYLRAGRNFLVSMPPGDLKADSTLDVSHEAFLRQWQRLQTWIDEEDKSVESYRQLTYHATQWKKGQGMLWRPPLLDQALAWKERQKPNEAWARRYNRDFAVCMEFLDACVDDLKQAREGLIARRPQASGWDRLTDRFYGHDFFLSYEWSDGQQYALALAQALQLRGFKCFIDTEQYAAGDNWQKATEGAMRRSLRFLLLASPAAIHSAAVTREVDGFRRNGRPIIAIDFGHTLEVGNESSLGNAIGPETVRVFESLPNLGLGPSNQVLDKIVSTFGTLRVAQRRKRLERRAVVALATFTVVFFFMAVFAAYQGVVARVAELKAVGARFTAIEALNQQLRTYTEPTAICGRIAAIASGNVPQESDPKMAMKAELAKLVSSEQPVILSKRIQERIADLERHIDGWSNTPQSNDELTQAVMAVVREYSEAWNMQSKKLSPDAQVLVATLIARPTYERVIAVTNQLAKDPNVPNSRREFEQLYWGELVPFETSEVANAMVDFRDAIQEDRSLEGVAMELKIAVKMAIAELPKASGPQGLVGD